MTYSGLRNISVRYCIAGIVLSLIIFLGPLAARYEENLKQTIPKFELIRTNTRKMIQATAAMDLIMDRIDAMLPQDYSSSGGHRELMLLAVDEIKKNLKGSEVTITEFDEQAGELSLPLNITVPVNDYNILVNQTGYLEALRFPHLFIRSVTIEKASETTSATTVSTQSGIICRITGLLRMPAGKKVEGRKHG